MKEIEILLQENFAIDEAAEFREKVNELIEKGESNFLINFRKCNFIDSTGLGVIVTIYKKSKERGGNLRICEINNSNVMKLFKLTRLDKVFEIFEIKE
jgi:anti-sigma B factor antagonist